VETWQRLHALLDQELQTLPDRYRAAIVLCDLEGKSIKEAARQLGCPLGTVGTRLARGRELLSKRLSKHGPALSSGVLTAVLSQAAASGGVPAPLALSTAKAASLFAARQAAIGVVSAKVATLTEGVLKGMLLNKLKIAAAMLFVFVAIGIGVYGPFSAPIQAEQLEVKKGRRNRSPSLPRPR
jgi:Sigma-70, region 4